MPFKSCSECIKIFAAEIGFYSKYHDMQGTCAISVAEYQGVESHHQCVAVPATVDCYKGLCDSDQK